MVEELPFDLLDTPAELARFQGWSEEVYVDLLAVQQGRMSPTQFDERHLGHRAILVLDLTGFTESAVRHGALQGFLRILNAQRVCLPVLSEHHAGFVRTFADDVVALFQHAGDALDAALEIQRRAALYKRSAPGPIDAADCCIGIGYGAVYEIGPNHAMGDEMNRTSKLGEDTARGGETLLTEGAYHAVRERSDLSFEPQTSDDLLFPYFRVREQ
jgi:class 3 adenylate cyclase